MTGTNQYITVASGGRLSLICGRRGRHGASQWLEKEPHSKRRQRGPLLFSASEAGTYIMQSRANSVRIRDLFLQR